MPPAVIGGAIAAVGAIGSAMIGARAARDQYRSQYAAESQAAMANARAGLRSAEAEARALLAGAGAEAAAMRAGAEREAAAAEQAAQLAYQSAYRNVELMKQEAEESLRKLDKEQTVYEAKAKAKVAASGGRYEGTSRGYVEAIEQENTAQFGWLEGAYENQRRVALANAAAERRASLGYASAVREGGAIRAGAIMAGAAARAGATRQIGRINWQQTQQAYAGAAAPRTRRIKNPASFYSRPSGNQAARPRARTSRTRNPASFYS